MKLTAEKEEKKENIGCISYYYFFPMGFLDLPINLIITI